jgi:GTP-binding protein Era
MVAVIGRPNVGKSTLVNKMVGEKVTITAKSPNTTRHPVRGILTDDDVQIIFVDTPGLHRPKTSLGGRLNDMARQAADGVDAVLALIDAGAEVGPGDRVALAAMVNACRHEQGPKPFVIVNKMDRVDRAKTAAQLMTVNAALEEIARDANVEGVIERVEYYPVSAKEGRGVDELVAAVREIMPEGPFLFPDDEVTDVPEAVYIAELVREQLVRKTREELPHSIHCRVTEFEWPHVTVEILVERESQKGMVIGKGGALLKEVGVEARRQLPEEIYLELIVHVEPSWQRRDDVLDRLGY